MPYSIAALDPYGKSTPIEIGHDLPDKCPRCHRNIHPRGLTATISPDERDAQVVFQCVSSQCEKLFIADYSLGNGLKGTAWYLIDVQPRAPMSPNVTALVAKLSPQFVKIYSQAAAAEAQGLDEVVGIALRKALEFLVKDFATEQHKDRKDEIHRMLLGQCIDNFVDDPSAKSCAKRAAWLGNDETHYLRKWETKDIEDLKRLVRLTSNWIDNVLLTSQYESEMPPGPTKI